MRFRIFAWICVFSLFTGLRVSYGQSDSCLKVLSSATDTTWSNPDSVKADSCIGSSTYGQLYCKGWFIVEFSEVKYPFFRQ